MKFEIDGVIYTDNIEKYLYKKQPNDVKIIKYNPLRKITVVNASYPDGSMETITDSRAIGEKKSEIYGVINYVKSLNLTNTPVTDPLTVGETLNHHTIKTMNTYKPHKEIHYITENKVYFKDEQILNFFKEKIFWMPNQEKVKIDDNIIALDINSFGASLLLQILKNRKVRQTIQTLHSLKIENNDDYILRKFMKYTLIGYVNSFLYNIEYTLDEVKKVPDDSVELYLEEEYNNMLIIGNTLYMIREHKKYSNIAPEYYETFYTQVWNHHVDKLKPLMVFGDNFYTKESNIPNNMQFGDEIGQFRKTGEIELLAGSPIPGIMYFVSRADKLITGCLNGELYGKINNNHYKIWSYLIRDGVC